MIHNFLVFFFILVVQSNVNAQAPLVKVVDPAIPQVPENNADIKISNVTSISVNNPAILNNSSFSQSIGNGTTSSQQDSSQVIIVPYFNAETMERNPF